MYISVLLFITFCVVEEASTNYFVSLTLFLHVHCPYVLYDQAVCLQFNKIFGFFRNSKNEYYEASFSFASLSICPKVIPRRLEIILNNGSVSRFLVLTYFLCQGGRALDLRQQAGPAKRDERGRDHRQARASQPS